MCWPHENNTMVMPSTHPSLTEQVRGGPEGVALLSIILRCSLISICPSMTEKVRGGPEGVALPSIILRGTVIYTSPSMKTYKS